MEANAYKEGWGQIIFQTANEMVNNDRLRERAERVAVEGSTERAWWDEKRERASRELMQDASTTSAADSVKQ
jgi:translocation protein SEC66